MLISKELNAAFNEEIGLELFSSHMYMAMAAQFDEMALKKLSALFFKQGEEERTHAMKFIKYLMDAGGKVQIPAIKAPQATYATVEEAIRASYDWELKVTERINALMSMAIDQRDYIAQDFLRWFETEQLEEVSSMDRLLKVVKQAGERNLIMLEAYLSHE